ncbi:MAG: hypothetical protein U9O98_10085 [Asgard group archaeon]|nr:hypothetical protein [Asgard group archaeon]
MKKTSKFLKKYFIGFTCLSIIVLSLLPQFSAIILTCHSQQNNFGNTDDPTPNQFPFVGQEMVYDIVQKTSGVISASGTLTIFYDKMVDSSTIHGTFHVLVESILDYYDERANGTENILNRELEINAMDTYIINLFMVSFFNFTGYSPSPLWILPNEIQVNATTQFWNYTATCEKTHSLNIMNNDYQVFEFRANGTAVELTLMYGFAKHGDSDWYGLLFYLGGRFYEPYIGGYMNANFILSETNAELNNLGEINRNTIIITTFSFYSLVVFGIITFRFYNRRDLVAGEV